MCHVIRAATRRKIHKGRRRHTTMTMTTPWGDESFIWNNAFAFLDVTDVGRCTTTSTLINQCAQQHFQQVPTIVQIAQHSSWGAPTGKRVSGPMWEPPFDGNQGAICLNRERPFAQLQQMIVSALNLDDEESYAVDIIYNGLLVGRTNGCNPPTFSKLAEGLDDPPHVDVAINFAYLEWKYLMRQIPLNDWIRNLRHTREAQLFAEGNLSCTHNRQMEADEFTHRWYHHEWDDVENEWFMDSPGFRPDSRPMQAYLALRILEADLRQTISRKYGVSTMLTKRGTQCGHGIFGMKFRWVPLYDFSGQVTYPGANEGVPYTHWGRNPPHFDQYVRWWDLPFPCVETNDET